MNHVITIGGLLSVSGIFLGVILAGFGAIAFMAGSMSDAPEEGNQAVREGCSLFIAGVLIAGFCVWSLA